MGSVLFVFIIIIGFTLFAMRWMYPRPPKGYLMPKPGESTAPRECNYCHHTLAEWRGIVDGAHFFCNAEHQADFLAGKTYQPYQQNVQ